jgi:hypothetical protein
MNTVPINVPLMSRENGPMIDETIQKEFEKIATRQIIRKLDRRIIPFMFILEMASYINRISVGTFLSFQSSIRNKIFLGHAKLMGIENDLNLSKSQSNWSISLFFMAYVRKLHYSNTITLNKSFR